MSFQLLRTALTWLLTLVLTATAGAIESVTYTFDRLTVGALVPQDLWKSFSNQTEDAAGSVAVAASSLGTVARRTGRGFSSGLHLRPNGNGFSIPTIDASTVQVILQFAVESQQHEGGYETGFALACNPEHDVSAAPRDNALLGPMIVRQRGGIGLRAAGNGKQFIESTALGDEAIEVRLVMAVTAAHGAGTGSLFYRSTIGSGPWQAVSGIQNRLLGLDPSDPKGKNPANWNALVVMNSYPNRAGSTRLTVEVSPTASETPLITPLTALLDHIAAPRVARDLSGTWEWTAVADLDSLPAADAKWSSVMVPGKHHSLFSKPLDVRKNGRVWFRTTFTLDAAEAARRVDLHCERIADRCLVVLNRTRIAEHTDGWSPFALPLASAQRVGENELLLGVTTSGVTTPPSAGALGRRPVGLSWFYGGFEGICFPVHVELHDPVWIAEVAVDPRLHGGSRLITRVTVRNDGKIPATVRVAGRVGAAFTHTPRAVTLASGAHTEVVLEDAWRDPPLWWPHDPQLRQLELQLENQGAVVDAVQQRFGFREIRVVGPDMLLNDVRLLHRRDTIISYQQFADGSALDAVLLGLRQRGINGVRTHLGPALRIARRCDELGLLVSPEAAICQPAGHQVEEEFWPAAQAHLAAMVRSMRNSPSVVYWCISNEFGAYYMPTDDRIPPGKRNRAWVDAWQADQVRRLALIDPTRIAVASGNGELGGWGAHGPGSALSLHYAWQPWKLHNQLPQTADWLVQGLKSWHGIVWDRTKPVMLSEDLFEPYCLNVPHGLSQWAGDSAYDPHGAIAAVRSAYRMFAAGNYRAGVAVWNPWGIGAPDPSKPSLTNELHAAPPLMPEHLVAWRGYERSFVGGSTSQRWIDVHHRGFQALIAPRVRLTMRDSERELLTQDLSITLPPGTSIDLPFLIALPTVAATQAVDVTLVLSDGERELSRQDERWMLCRSAAPILPSGTVWLGPGAPKGITAATDLDAALAARPSLIVVAQFALDEQQLQRLLDAATSGLHVLWLETPDKHRLPPPLHAGAGFNTAYAFIRSPTDPVCAGLAPELLSAWRPTARVCAEAIPKSELADWRVLIDVGGPSGMSHAAVARRVHGAGTLTVCQLAILSGLAAGEPAAAELLNRLAATPMRPSARAPLLLLADAASPVRTALERARVPATGWVTGATGVLLVDAASAGWLDAVSAHLAAAGTVLVHRPDAQAVATLAARCSIGLRSVPANDRHLLRNGADPLSDGIANDDLWWEPAKGYEWLAPEKTAGKPPIISSALAIDSPAVVPFMPAGLIAVTVGRGRLVVDTVRWSECLGDQPVRSLRYLRTILGNLGADLGSAPVADWACLDIAPLCTTALAGNASGGGWPGPGRDDLRYFPVNRTGMDPRLNVPAPVVPMPVPVHLAGVPFRITERVGEPARDAIVPTADQVVALPATGLVSRLWLAGGNASWVGDGKPLLRIIWRYADGSQREVAALGGEHLGPVIERTPVRTGLVGWIGPTPTRDDAVVWVWPMENPEPARELNGIELRGITGTCAVVGATLERGR